MSFYERHPRLSVYVIARLAEQLSTSLDDPATAATQRKHEHQILSDLVDAALAAESEFVPVMNRFEQSEALAHAALRLVDLLDHSLASRRWEKARTAVTRLHRRIDLLRTLNVAPPPAVDSLLGEVLEALGHQGGTRQQALDEIRRLRSVVQAKAPIVPDVPAQETRSWSRDVAGVAVAHLADLPIGSVTAHPDGAYATVRQPYGWDLATGSEGLPFHVSSGWGGHEPSGEVVLVGNGEIPEEWTWTYDGVAALVRDWVARHNEALRKVDTAVPDENVAPTKSLAATLLAQAEAAALQAEKQPGNPVDGVEPPSESAPEPVATIVSDEASSRVEWLRDLPIGTITVYARLGMARVRLPDGWDLAVGSSGAVYDVAPHSGMEPDADEDVVRIGTGTVPDSWRTSHAEVAEIARAWLVERGAVPSSLASEPLAPIDTDDDGDCPF